MLTRRLALKAAKLINKTLWRNLRDFLSFKKNENPFVATKKLSPELVNLYIFISGVITSQINLSDSLSFILELSLIMSATS
jgi:hypothetical protein